MNPNSQSGRFTEAVGTLDTMISKGCIPSREMFGMVLDTCIRGRKTSKVSSRPTFSDHCLSENVAGSTAHRSHAYFGFPDQRPHSLTWRGVSGSSELRFVPFIPIPTL